VKGKQRATVTQFCFTLVSTVTPVGVLNCYIYL